MFTNKFKSSNRGLVSITVAIIMMTILALLVVAFSLLARREQRLALDRRLSSQAYYAAESGINKVVNDIKKNITITDVTDCTPTDIVTSNVQTTCSLVDVAPPSLVFDGISSSQAKVILLSAVNSGGAATNIKRLEVYWDAVPNSENFSSTNSGVFPVSANYSVLRIGLTRLGFSTPFTRDDLDNNTYHAFLYPKTSGTATTTAAIFNNDAQQGVVIEGNCVTGASPKNCKAIISVDSPQFLLKISSVYQNADVELRAYDAVSGGNQLNFTGAQAVVDSTGRAGDVLRRIQARVPLDLSWNADNWAVNSDQICKTYTIAGTSTTSGSGNCPFN